MVDPDNYNDNQQPEKRTPAEQFPWSELTRALGNESLIPIIGSEVYEVNGKNLYDIIAGTIDQLNNPRAYGPDKHTFHKVAGRFLQKKGQYHSHIKDKIRDEVKKYSYDQFEYVLMLAKIRKFRVYINTSYDDQLYDALKFVGRDVTKINYGLNSRPLETLHNYKTLLAKDDSAIVLNVFGNISKDSLQKDPLPSFDEKDLIETISCLMADIGMSGNQFFTDLQSSSHLFIGCIYKNWLMRFVARSITNFPFDPKDDKEEKRFFSSNILTDDVDVNDRVSFLKDYQSKIFYPGTTGAFITALYDLAKQQDEAVKMRNESAISNNQLAEEKQWIIDNHNCFVSFSGEAQRHFAKQLNIFLNNSELKGNKIRTWFDERSLVDTEIVDDTIKRAIFVSRVMIVVVGKTDNDLQYKSREVEWAKNFNKDRKPADSITILSVTLGDIPQEKVPDVLKTRVWTRFADGNIFGADGTVADESLANKLQNFRREINALLR